MKGRVCVAIVVMGFSGLVAEILLLRELLIVFSGNELSIGVILANWLVIEAFGCFLAGRVADRSRKKLEAFAVTTFLFSLSLLIAVFQTRVLKRILGVSIGESLGLVPIFYSSFLILLPVSILHGALYTFSCWVYSAFAPRDSPAAGTVYVYETVGTMVGGIASTYLLVPHLNAFQVSVGLAMLNSIVSLVLLAADWKSGLLQKAILVSLSVLAVFSGYLLLGGQANRVHEYSVRAQWKNLNVVHYENSQYGNICVIENQGQYIFFQDGIPSTMTPVPDVVSVEEFVHLPLLAHPEPVRVLIVSGGAGGVINEVLKHPSVDTIEYTEIDPLLLTLLRRFPTPLTESELNDRRVKIRHMDGRLLLKTTPNHYDLVFVGIMEPSNLQTNRFFTKEFFSLAKSRLNEGGILVLGLPGSLTFLNEQLRDLNSCIFHTLSSVFSHIRVIPGDDRNLFLASDSPGILALDEAQVIARVGERDITANVMVPWYIENRLHQGWQDWFAHFIKGGSRDINRDFRPVGLFFSIAHWNAVFAPALARLFTWLEPMNVAIIFASFALLLLCCFLRSRDTRGFPAGIPVSIATTGFAGMIFDLVVVFAFQAIYGYVFSWIGLLVASFMAGAACGAMGMTAALARTRYHRRLFIGIDLAIICLSIGLPLILLAVDAFGQSTFWFLMLFVMMSFFCGLLVGSQFPLANKLYRKNGTSPTRTAALLYASDLLGGWVGGIAGAVVLLPVLGIAGTCVIVGLLKLVSLIVVAAQPRRCL